MMTQRFWFDDMKQGSKAYDRLCGQMRQKPTILQAERIGQQIAEIHNKLRPVGGVAAYMILQDCMSDKDCYDRIKGLFLELDRHEGYTFINHHTQEPCTGTQALFGDMQTLWMRRIPDHPMDVLEWLQERDVL